MDVSLPLSVTELTARIKQTLEQGFAHIEVEGEVSRLTKPASGHMYFTIKDSHASISAAVWRSAALRLNTQPKEGQSFIFSGHLSLYEPRGTYQIIVTRISPVGAGQLAAEFERRKLLFSQRGWFEKSHKKPITALPHHIGIVTSGSSAAFEDVKKVLSSRPAWLQLTLAPCLVQGSQAPAQIAQALIRLQQISSPPDLILLVRGGGSMEDLWCFNDETVVKAIADSSIPIISGIGHEIDTTLADLAADIRAATPSNAAELACPAKHDLRQRIPPPQRLFRALKSYHSRALQTLRVQQQGIKHLQQRYMDKHIHQGNQLQQRFSHAFKIMLHTHKAQLNHATKRLLPQAPGKKLQHQRHQLHHLEHQMFNILSAQQLKKQQKLQHSQEKLSALCITYAHQKQRQYAPVLQRLTSCQAQLNSDKQKQSTQLKNKLQLSLQNSLQQQRHKLHILHEKLHTLNPQHVLKRGYSLSFDAKGQLITQTQQVQEGDTVLTHFHDGMLHSRVEKVSVNRK
ncbi:MAG: exodeoxyribonuclease VII large subunit [Mariprofundaceae bacterium]